MTILSFAAVFAGLGLVGPTTGYGSAATLVTGVFLGSALWWFTLSSAVGALRTRISPAGLQWINRVAGLVIIGFGLFGLLSGICAIM